MELRMSLLSNKNWFHNQWGIFYVENDSNLLFIFEVLIFYKKVCHSWFLKMKIIHVFLITNYPHKKMWKLFCLPRWYSTLPLLPLQIREKYLIIHICFSVAIRVRITLICAKSAVENSLFSFDLNGRFLDVLF